MKKKWKAIKRTPLFDEARAWVAQGPGRGNSGFILPVIVRESDGDNLREIRENKFYYFCDPLVIRAFLTAQELVAREVRKLWGKKR